MGEVVLYDGTMTITRRVTMPKALTSENSPLRIDAIKLPGNRGHIGMTFCPGKKDRGYSGTDWDRDLATDLDAIVNWGADVVVTLLEEFELQMMGIPALPSLLEDIRLLQR